MCKLIFRLRNPFMSTLFLVLLGCQGPQINGPQVENFFSPPAEEPREQNFLGPQSIRAKGEKKVLMVAVRFADVEPKFSLSQIQSRVVTDLNEYVQEQSYGLTSIKARFIGWVTLPDSISAYRISPDNFKVDRRRVRKLIEDTMTGIEREVDFSQYQYMLIIPGATTLPGKGYGMMCYCANPGMLTGVRGNPRYVTLRSKGGGEFSGGIFVGTENAPLGMFAHDFFHALGGVYANKRLVPCLYDFERQADASRQHKWEECTTYVGTWDVMSSHLVDKKSPPPGTTSFTKIRLGWISSDQVLLVRPGEDRGVFLSPLARGGESLVVKVPLAGGKYYLVENRQPLGFDRVQKDSGILVLKVNPDAQEGQGKVKIMDGDPASPNFSHATFRLDRQNRNVFVDTDNHVAIIPLWAQGEKQGVLVTTPEKSGDALKAALMIRELWQIYPEPRQGERKQLIEECVESFRRFDFKKSYEIGQQVKEKRT